jgi:glycosyltransferase involved in cell wall biosynthesis
MRIGVNGRFLAAPLSGVQRFAREVLVRLAAVCDTVVFLPRSAPEPPADATGRRIAAVRGSADGVLWEQRELPRMADRHCDLLLHPANTGSTARVPHVLVLHYVLPLTHPEWFSTTFSLWYRALIPRIARSAAGIITSSAHSRRELCRVTGAVPGRVVLAPQGVAPFETPAADAAVAAVRARYALPEHFLLAVGGDRRKNTGFLFELLRTWQPATDPTPAIGVVGAPLQRVHGRTVLAGAPPGVYPLGHVSDAELHALYTAADALCFPSHAEGFGRPPLEAAACGTPAIAAPYATARETLDGLCATRIVPLDVQRWRSALRRARAAPADVRVADAAAVRRRWRWDDAAAAVLDACERAHQRARAGRPRVSAAPARQTRRAGAPAAGPARIALVHDWLTGMRGGERVLEELVRMYPSADVFALLHVPGSVSGAIEDRLMATSFVDRLPFARRAHRFFLPLYPSAAERLDLTGYDIVISSSHCAAKGVRSAAPHLCYCHTPMRYIWDRSADYARSSLPVRAGMALLAPRLQRWDVRTAARPDRIIANSRHVQRRIERCWQRASAVVYPPVDVDRFVAAPRREDYFVMAGALVPYKRVDIAIRAFNDLGRRLLVIGTGPEYARLRSIAGPTVEFAGHVSDGTLAELLARARALVMPMVEDFGIIAVEAQAAGTPVIAFADGGALETVRGWTPAAPDGATGLFFATQSAGAFGGAVVLSDGITFDPAVLLASARRFSPDVFRSGVRTHVRALLGH